MAAGKKAKIANGVVPFVGLIVFVVCVLQGVLVYRTVKSRLVASAEIEYLNLAKAYTSFLEEKLRRYSSELERYVNSQAAIMTKDPAAIVEWARSEPNIRPADYDYVGIIDINGNFEADNGSSSKVADRDYFQERRAYPLLFHEQHFHSEGRHRPGDSEARDESCQKPSFARHHFHRDGDRLPVVQSFHAFD